MELSATFRKRLSDEAASLLRETGKTSFMLFKIMVPISIATKILADLGLIDHLSVLLAPAMKLVGLPGSMGLVWAAAMLTSLSGGIAAFLTIAPSETLTAEQITVLSAMMLVAHALPLELRIAQKAGPRLRGMLLLRVGGALAFGWALHMIYSHGGWLQQAGQVAGDPQAVDPSWWAWAQSQGLHLLKIFAIILGLLLLLRVLKLLGITALLTWLLKPVLKGLGMSEAAAPVTIIGMTLGIGYGGALLIREARSGELDKRDVFSSLSLLALCHSLIEDTFLMKKMMGADLSGILWARIVFALAVTFVLVKLTARIPEAAFDRFFCGVQEPESKEADE